MGYATLTRDYAILPMLGRSYWPMLAMLSLPYAGYAMLGLILAYSDSNKIPLYLPSCYYLPLAGGAFADKTVCARAPSLRAVEERAHPAGSGPTGLRQPRARWEAREVTRFAVAKTSSAEPRRRRRARPPTHRPGLDARPPTPPLGAAGASANPCAADESPLQSFVRARPRRVYMCLR